LFALAIALACPIGVRAAEYFVSPSGNDSHAGTLAQPWKTVSKGAATAEAGDTVYVRAGVYQERITLSRSGTAGSRITLRNYPSEVPVLDGTGQAVGGQTAMIDVAGRDYVTIAGFEIRNLTTAVNSQTPLGILISGAAIGIEIERCEIHTIQNNGSNGNAHGILVSGSSPTAISDLAIRDCLIRDLVLGNSEALAVNGNVDGFEIRGNTVRDCNNIGIDFIGFEGTGPTVALDQARNGICADNIVHGCSTVSNPAYPFWSCAGIYVDGGRDIVIERNRVYLNDIGIELASEHAGRATENVTVRDNLVWRNLYGGIFTGGYNASVGSTENCVITGNTLFENDSAEDGNGEFYVRYKTYGLEVKNNIVVANAQGLVISRISTDTSGLDFDYNLYNSSGTDQWSWGNASWFSGFSNWQSTSGQDANSMFTAPGLVDATGAVGDFDLRIQSTSAARDAGDPAFVAAPDQTDGYGGARVVASVVDVGAHEYSSVNLSALQLWRLSYFDTTQGLGKAADLADPESDRRANLLEFALGTHPKEVDGEEVFTTIAPGFLGFSFNTDASSEVEFTIYSSEDLSEGSWGVVAVRAKGGGWTAVTNVSVEEVGSDVLIADDRPSNGQRFYEMVVKP
jgi:hypothetical protein